MFKKIFIGILVLGAGSFFFFSQKGEDKAIEVKSEQQTSAWIEVIAPSAHRLAADEVTIEHELATGDEVLAGMVIATEKAGRAVIHFPDGSVLRLDKDSKIKLEESYWSSESEDLKVTVNLLAGRVWSKIIELTTPESHWEVKTSNAVATVRGTAFGMEFDAKKKSRIIGSEHSVSVGIINPKTKKRIEAAEAIVGEEKILEIKDEVALELAVLEDKATSTPLERRAALKEEFRERVGQVLAVKAATKEVLREEWVATSEKEDGALRERIEELKDEGLTGRELRREIRKEFFEEVREELTAPEQSAGEETSVELKQPEVEPDAVSKETTLREELIQIKTETTEALTEIREAAVAEILPVSLDIITRLSSNRITEGETIRFEAVATFSDGTKKPVTDRVEWSVVGGIGKILSPGVFFAELSPDIREQGEAPGAVTAGLKNEKYNLSLFAKSPIFTVELKTVAPAEPIDIGGQ